MVKREALTALVVELAKWHLDHPFTDDVAMQESAIGTPPKVDRSARASPHLGVERTQGSRVGRASSPELTWAGHARCGAIFLLALHAMGVLR